MPENYKSVKLSVVIVAYNNEDVMDKLLETIHGQLDVKDRIILVDNHPKHLSAKIAGKKKFVHKIIKSENIGFGAACNLGAKYSKGTDLLFFINPDSLPEKDAIDELKKAYIAKPNWAAWMSLLLLNNGKVNSCGCEVHLTGLSWAKGVGAKADDHDKPVEIDYISGACLAIRTEIFEEIGGFTGEYFMYFEDTEISTKLMYRNYKAGLWPKSRVVHDYSFENGKNKWFYLERNRPLYLLTCWPLSLIIMLSPLLLLTEILLWPIAIVQRRVITKARAYYALLKMTPFIYSKRKEIQNNRSISTYKIMQTLATELDNPYLGRASKSKFIGSCFRLYKNIAIGAMSLFGLK